MNETLRQQLLLTASAAGYSPAHFSKVEQLQALLSRDCAINRFDLLHSFIRNPALFSCRSETLDNNVTRTAALVGIEKERFVTAALKQPSLLCLSPENIAAKLPIVQAIARQTDQPAAPSDILDKFPTALTYARPYLHLRLILARATTCSSWTSLVAMPSAKAEPLVVAHYLDQIYRTGRGARTLQVLHSAGRIKTLPAAIQPLSR